ncbi:RagB/SusD family nutrient uptake outer membrane protein [Hymenobacter psychrophilus]|uniref:Starch-binding associating with outer membrane n=1 Tax=Hymenobacter psychrophilus TaxID=651662 RepID=A0A1H3LAY9_9BACT|nr:RagB/SusD family nutrient uptake outer membrane protein [Hymenobacter psychrophilus]SDY61114.1 Starch-binding associating with outer membrane [Hymenobacter psychrophilus]
MKKIFYTAAFAGLLLTAGCQNYLDVTPPSNLVEDSYFATTGEVETGVINIYSTLQDIPAAEIQLSELRSDNMAPNNFEGDWANIENFTETPSSEFVTTFWRNSYYAIGRANLVLKYLNNVTDADKKARFEGEARFARALMLFNLVRLYGDVPLPLSTVLNSDTDVLRRRPVADVYAQILLDLQAAEGLLPVTWEATGTGRATKGAARALLAKVQVTRGDYAAAKTTLETLLAAGTYQLLPSYATVFAPGNELNREIIFAIRYKTASNGEGQGFSYDFSKDGATRGLKGLTDLQALFVTADAERRNTSLTGTGATAYVNKFPDAANTGARRDAGTDWIVLRYGEVQLLYAEVLNQLNGPTAAALVSLNAIRKRAGVPEYTLATLGTKASFQAALETERRLELAFENYRWYDLLRWNKAIEAMTAHFKAVGRPNVTVPAFRLLYPVPQREIDVSKGVITQNPGYN